MKRIHLLILISALLIIGLISCSSRLNPSDDNSSEAKENNILDNINGASDNDNPTATSGVKELSSNSETSENNSHNSSSDNPNVVSEMKEPSSSSGNSTDNTQTGSSGSEKSSTPPKVPTTFLERVKGATYKGEKYTYEFSEDGKTITCYKKNGDKYDTYTYDEEKDDSSIAIYYDGSSRFKYWGLKLYTPDVGKKDGELYWSFGANSDKWAAIILINSHKAIRQ